MGQVRTTFSSEDKDVQKALDQMTKSLARYVEENRKLKEASKQTRDESKSGFESMVKGWATAGSAIALATGLLRDYNAGLREQAALQERAASAARSTSASQGEFINNLGNVSLGEMQRSVAAIDAVSKRTGVPLNVLYNTAGIASASKGNLSLGQSLAHVEQATRLTRQPAQLPEVAMGLLNVSNFLGTTDPKTAAGFLLAMGEQSPVPQMSQIAANLVPAAKNVAARGGTAAEAAALVNTIASSMQDPEGRMAGTAAISLSEQLAEQVPGQADTLARLRFLQQNQGAAQAFVKKSSFEKKAQATIEALLDPASPQSALLQSNIAKFPGTEGLAAQFDQFVGKKESFPLQAFASVEGALAQNIEAGRLANERGQMAGVIREQLEQALGDAGVPTTFLGMEWASRRAGVMRGFDHALQQGSDPFEAGIDVLTGEIRQQAVTRKHGAAQVLIDMRDELRAIRANQRAPGIEDHRE